MLRTIFLTLVATLWITSCSSGLGATDLVTFNTLVDSKGDALFVPAMAEECIRHDPNTKADWNRMLAAYQQHFRQTYDALQTQYEQTLGTVIPSGDFDAGIKKIYARQMAEQKMDFNNVCPLAAHPKGLEQLIKTYPLDRSEKGIGDFFKKIEDGSFEKFAQNFNKMPENERKAFAEGFLKNWGK